MAVVNIQKNDPATSHSPQASWREDVLLRITRIVAMFSLVPIVIDILIVVSRQQYERLLVNLVAFVVILVLGLYPHLPFSLRLGGLLGIIYLSGAFLVLVSGLVGTGRIYLFELAVLAALLLHRRGAIAVWLLSLLTVGVVYTGFVGGWLPLPLAIVERMFEPPTLLVSWMGQAVASAMVVTAVLVMVQHLRRSLQATEAARAELQRLNAELEQRVAERTADLRESEQRFRTAVDNMLDGFSIFTAVRDAQGSISDFHYDYINPSGIHLLDMPSEAMRGQLFHELYPDLAMQGFFDAYVHVVETGEPFVNDDFTYESTSADGQPYQRCFEFRAVKMNDGFALTWRDITELRKLEAQQQQQARHAGIVEERSRLARELHDSVAQSLYSLLLLTNGWRKMAEQNRLAEHPSACFRELGTISQQALKEMRLLIHQLRPTVLTQNGLVDALQQRLEAVEQRAGVEIHLLTEGHADGLPHLVEENLFYIAQEALNNALRHAGATAVTVRLCTTPETLTLSVQDNGCGFDPSTRSMGMGLITMRERAAAIQGHLTITSTPQQGTRIDVLLGDETRRGYG